MCTNRNVHKQEYAQMHGAQTGMCTNAWCTNRNVHKCIVHKQKCAQLTSAQMPKTQMKCAQTASL